MDRIRRALISATLVLGVAASLGAAPTPTPSPSPVPTPAPSPHPPVHASPHRLHLGDFRIAGIGLLNNQQEHDVSVWGGWTPAYLLSRHWYVRGMVGATMLDGLTSSFLVLDYEAGVGYMTEGHLAYEVLGGIQSWRERGDYVTGTGMAFYRFGSRFLGILDRLFLGYSYVANQFQTHELRLGAQLVFF